MMPDVVRGRVEEERNELVTKIDKLSAYIRSDNDSWNSLSFQSKVLLIQQEICMLAYWHILNERIALDERESKK